MRSTFGHPRVSTRRVAPVVEHREPVDGGAEHQRRESLLPADTVGDERNLLEDIRGSYGTKTSSPVATATTTR